jgi:hypothetical protein
MQANEAMRTSSLHPIAIGIGDYLGDRSELSRGEEISGEELEDNQGTTGAQTANKAAAYSEPVHYPEEVSFEFGPHSEGLSSV